MQLSLPISLTMITLKEWASNRHLFLSIENLTEILWWTVKSAENFQIKNLNNNVSLLKAIIKNQFVLIPWFKIIKVLFILKPIPKLNLSQWQKVDFKIMMLVNPGYPEILMLERLKKGKIKQIKFTWMGQFQSQNNNPLLSWKNNVIKSTWDQVLSNKNQKDNLFLNLNLPFNVHQLPLNRYLTQIIAL